VNFKTLVSQSSDVLSRLRLFLHLSLPWPSNTTLPKPEHADFDPGLSCSLRAQLVKRFEREGPLLARDLTSAGPAHKQEPAFRAFDLDKEAPACGDRGREKEKPKSSNSTASNAAKGSNKLKKALPSAPPTPRPSQ